MNLLQKLGLRLAGRATKNRTTSETLPRHQRNQPYYPRYKLTARDAIREAYTATGLVYACIRLITNSAASVPLNAYTRDGDEWKHAPQHPLQALLNQPNPSMSRRRLYTRTMQHLLLTGNSIWTKIRVPKNGPPTQLWPINPDLITPVPDSRDLINHYELNIDGIRHKLEPQDVIHVQIENPDTPYWGLGPLQAAMLDVNMYKGNKGWNLRVVEHGAVVPGALTVANDLTDEQFKRLREQLDARSFGHEDAGRELILGEGLKYERMSLTGVEIGYLESMRFGREEIAMIFGVPSALLTPENATLANVDAYNKQFWENTIVPLNVGVADTLGLHLVPDFGDASTLAVEHDYSRVPAMQENLLEQATIAHRFVRAGFTVEGVNRVLDLGFEEDEIAPEPAPARPDTDPAAELVVRSRKDDELTRAWRARDEERRRWEARVTPQVQALFTSEGAAVVSAYRARPTFESVVNAVRLHETAWLATLEAVSTAVYEHFARAEYARLTPKQAFDPLELAIEYARTYGAQKVTRVTDTTIEYLARIVAEGLTIDPETGFRPTIDSIAANLTQQYGDWIADEGRAYMIARTESGNAMNHAHQTAAERAAIDHDLQLEKVWASAGDERVRDTHMIHGEAVPMDGIFSNGLAYPNDPMGDAAEVINCRCTVVHRVRRPS